MEVGRMIRYGLPVVLAAVIVAIAWQNRPPAEMRIAYEPVGRTEDRPGRGSSSATDESRTTVLSQPTASVVEEQSAQVPLLSSETLSDPRRTREELLAIPLSELRTIVGTKTLDRYVSGALRFDPGDEEERAAAMQFLQQLNERIRAAKKS